MSNMMDITINRLPAPTWRWMKLNAAQVKEVPQLSEGTLLAEVPHGLVSGSAKPRLSEIETGSGRELDEVFARAGIGSYLLKSRNDTVHETPVRLDFRYGEVCRSANAVEISCGENSSMSVIMDCRSTMTSEGTAAVQTRIRAKKGSKVTLVQVHRMGEKLQFFNDIGCRAEDGARIEIIQLIIGCGKTYEGMRADLAGVKSSFRMDTAYIVQGTQELDMNYAVNHIGRRTESELYAGGVLRDKGRKLFRGTIDLRRGASGAVGTEKEDVLLIDDTVINQTIPLILCDEEDVEGNHGATIGKLDEELMFYMRSRGIPDEVIYEMMAEARVEALLGKIPDEKTRCRVRDFRKESKRDNACGEE